LQINYSEELTLYLSLNILQIPNWKNQITKYISSIMTK